MNFFQTLKMMFTLIRYSNVDVSKYPQGPETLKKALDFLPNEDAKNGLVYGFVLVLSFM